MLDRLAILQINFDVLVAMYRAGFITCQSSILPEDAVVTSARIKDEETLELVMGSECFEVVQDGDPLPVITIPLLEGSVERDDATTGAGQIDTRVLLGTWECG